VYEERDEESKGRREKGRVVDYLGVEGGGSERLVLRVTSSELDGAEERLRLAKPLLQRFPSLELHTMRRDAHCYLLARWTLALLEERRELLQSVPRHFVPHLLELQWRRLKRSQRLHLARLSAAARAVSAEARYMSGYARDARDDALDGLELDTGDGAGGGASASGGGSGDGYGSDHVRCYAMLLAEGAGSAGRVSDLTTYLSLNRALAGAPEGQWAYTPAEPLTVGKQRAFVAASAQVDAQTQIPSGCVLGDGSKLGARVGVKKSVLGRHCTIGAGAKLINCVLLDHVTVAENAKLHNCVIGANSYIERDAELTDCFLGARCSVNKPGLVVTKRKLDPNSQLS